MEFLKNTSSFHPDDVYIRSDWISSAWPSGYNIGDIVHAFKLPYPHNKRGKEERDYARPALIAELPESIGGRYCRSLQDISYQGPPIPDLFKNAVSSHSLDASLHPVLELVKKPSTLCVHLRLGDKGKPSSSFLKLCKESVANHETSILFFGLHKRHDIYDAKQRDRYLKNSIKVVEELLKTKDGVFILTAGSTDDHLHLLSNASNFLPSVGGFSSLAVLTCQGKIIRHGRFVNEFPALNW